MAILNTEEYAYIIPPSAQFNDENGKPYSAGFVEFYKHGTSERYITYADWSGSFNPFRIPLNSQGRAVAIVPKDVFLDMYVYNFLGNLAYSRLNVNYIGEGGFTTDNLVRGIVPESDNVHTRVARTLEDGTQIYGISVDEDLWIAQAIAPNDWTPSQSTPQGVLRWYNKKLYYHITNVNTDVPPDEDPENWKSTTISDFLKSFNIDWGKLVATNTGTHGIGPWTKKSGSVDVVGGYLQLEAERIYHFTLQMEISNETYSENYYTGYITADSDGSSMQPEFELDGSKRNQIAEVSWDGAATEEDLKCYLVPTLPSGFSVTNAVLWLHSINNTIITGSGSIVVDDELSLDSDNPVQNRVVTAALNTKANSADLAPIATSGSWNDLQDVPTDLVEDPNYVHTDENFTEAEKDKLAGIQAGAEANVQSDWTQTDSSADNYIKNKPENLVQDPNYVHTDNNFTTTEKDKLAGVEAGAEKNVNADWNAASGDAEILNKPDLSVYKEIVYITPSNNAGADAATIAAALNAGKVVVVKDVFGSSSVELLVSGYIIGGYYNFTSWADTRYVYSRVLNYTNNTWSWSAITKKTIMPNYGSSQSGKLLTVNSAGNDLEWANAPQSDWNETDTTDPSYIKNKPTIYDAVFVAIYNVTTRAEIYDAFSRGQQILFKKSAATSGADAWPIVPEKFFATQFNAYVNIIEYNDSTQQVTRYKYSVNVSNVWSVTSEVVHQNTDEVATAVYGTAPSASLRNYLQNGRTILLNISNSKWLPLYSGNASTPRYVFRDIQPSQDGKKLQAVEYQWNGSAWSTTYTDIYESQPGTVVLTTSNTIADIKAALADGSVPVLQVGSFIYTMYYASDFGTTQGTYRFARTPDDSSSNNQDYVYSISNVSSETSNPNQWEVRNELLLQVDWDSIDSNSPDYIKNKPNTQYILAGTDITLTEVDGRLRINSTAVPAHTSAESSKILSVDSNGNLVWVSPSASSQVQSDWSQTDSTQVDYIKNKPDLSVYALAANVPVIHTITL